MVKLNKTKKIIKKNCRNILLILNIKVLLHNKKNSNSIYETKKKNNKHIIP